MSPGQNAAQRNLKLDSGDLLFVVTVRTALVQYFINWNKACLLMSIEAKMFHVRGEQYNHKIKKLNRMLVIFSVN